MSEQKTHAGIIAEMRGIDNKCQLATKDGTGCYHCPFGSAASNCLFDKFADELEAAHKRELEAVGNATKLRKASDAINCINIEGLKRLLCVLVEADIFDGGQINKTISAVEMTKRALLN